MTSDPEQQESPRNGGRRLNLKAVAVLGVIILAISIGIAKRHSPTPVAQVQKQVQTTTTIPKTPDSWKEPTAPYEFSYRGKNNLFDIQGFKLCVIPNSVLVFKGTITNKTNNKYKLLVMNINLIDKAGNKYPTTGIVLELNPMETSHFLVASKGVDPYTVVSAEILKIQ